LGNAEAALQIYFIKRRGQHDAGLRQAELLCEAGILKLIMSENLSNIYENEKDDN